MTENMPAELIGAERRVYVAGADRARVSYRKRHGATGLQTIAERRAWNESHSPNVAAAAMRGGLAAVRKMHTARVVALATMSDATRVGGAATGAHLATLTRQAEYAAARLEILATIDGKAPSKAKAPARKLASVPDVVAAPVEIAEPVETPAPVDIVAAAVDSGRVTVTTVGRDGKVRKSRKLSPADCAPAVSSAPVAEPVDVPAAPSIVPAPMPAMTRAARKATRRELAATMRAAGIKPEGFAWREACRAAGLFAADDSEVSA